MTRLPPPAPRARRAAVRTLAALTAVLTLGGALAGCDTAIDTPDSLRGSYTLWGALDPTADVQAVRVVPVTDSIGLGSAAPLPVAVVSVDLATAAETPWRDSVVTFRDGSVGHVFTARLRPAYGSRHRVVVRRDGGGEVSALVAVPPFVAPVVQRVQRLGGGVVLFPVLWPGAPQLNRVRVTYTLVRATGEVTDVTRVLVGTSGPVEFGWQTVVDVGVEDDRVQREAGGEPGDFALRNLRVTAEVASEDWRPPGGVFDPEVLAEPGSLGNVEGGFGFVGAAYDVSADVQPLSSDLTATSFAR